MSAYIILVLVALFDPTGTPTLVPIEVISHKNEPLIFKDIGSCSQHVVENYRMLEAFAVREFPENPTVVAKIMCVNKEGTGV